MSKTLVPLDDQTINFIKTLIKDTGYYTSLSLGAGLQSSALFLMNLLGLIEPRAEFAIFADTGYERKATYEYLEYLDEQAVKYGYPKVMRVTAGNIKEDSLKTDSPTTGHIPFFTESGTKTGGQLRRQCTGIYKIEVCKREIRKVFGMKKRIQWIGFSMDELKRRNDTNFPKYIKPRYPLLEMRMTRKDTYKWLKDNDFPIPEKSACVCCPFRTNIGWKRMKETNPEEWNDAKQFDKDMRGKGKYREVKTPQLTLIPEQKHDPSYNLFLHPTITPLEEVDLSNVVLEEDDEDIQQIDLLDDEFGCNDAEGGCHI